MIASGAGIVHFRTRYDGPHPELTAREWNEVMRTAYEWGGRYWHAKFRDEHFKNSASRKYGYRPRKGEAGNPQIGRKGRPLRFRSTYTGQKLRKYGHTRPLELTGKSRSDVRRARIAATSTKGMGNVKVRMNAPTLNFRPTGWPFSIRQELLLTTPTEIDACVHVIEGKAEQLFPRLREQRTIEH